MNVFWNCKSVPELLGQLAGAASMCWEPHPEGIFDTTLAVMYVGDALVKLEQLQRNLNVNP